MEGQNVVCTLIRQTRKRKRKNRGKRRNASSVRHRGFELMRGGRGEEGRQIDKSKTVSTYWSHTQINTVPASVFVCVSLHMYFIFETQKAAAASALLLLTQHFTSLDFSPPQQPHSHPNFRSSPSSRGTQLVLRFYIDPEFSRLSCSLPHTTLLLERISFFSYVPIFCVCVWTTYACHRHLHIHIHINTHSLSAFSKEFHLPLQAMLKTADGPPPLSQTQHTHNRPIYHPVGAGL